jgi:hypothetical protein
MDDERRYRDALEDSLVDEDLDGDDGSEPTAALSTAREAEGAPSGDGGASGSVPDRAPAGTLPQGPYDRSEVHNLNGRLDLGSLWITGVPGMELRIEADEESGQLVGAMAVLGESALHLQAYAAPRSGGIWDAVRDELAQSIATQGGTAEGTEGSMGAELRTLMPSAGSDGRPVLAPARFIGVEGPRWLLRGVLSGRAAVEETAAEPLLEFFRRVVVVRGPSPMAPREVLPLKLPEQLQPATDPAAGPADQQPAGQESGADRRAPLSPFERGPEITEVR